MHNDQFFTVSSRQQREADLFFAELTGRPPFRPREDQILVDAGSYPEAVAKWDKRTVPGAGKFNHDGYKVEARWNFDKQAAQARPDQKIDMVVYLHGYGAPRTRFLAEKARNAGLDMVDSNGVATVRNNKPTLALVPKATYYRLERRQYQSRDGTTKTRQVHHRLFPKLYKKRAFDNLLTAALRWLELEVLNYGTCALTPGKITLMAHSGGGAAMNRLLNDGLVPDEVVCFDSTYGSANPIIKWVERKIASGSSAKGGLCIFYRGGGTANAARQIKTAVNRALQRQNANCATLARRYRVEQTRVGHGDIPKAFSGLLLNDITATVPRTTASRSPCTASTG